MLDQLRLRAPWIALCVIIAAGATYFISRQQANKYTAAASLRFKSTEPGRNIAAFPAAAASSAQAEWAANMSLVRGGDLAAKTAGRLRQGLTPGKVNAALRVSAPREWGTVRVAATSTSAQLAAAIPNTYVSILIAEQQRREYARYAAAVARVEKQLAALPRKQRSGPRGRALHSRARSLQLFSKVQSGNIRPARAASVPGAPASPRLVRNTALGAAGGLLLGLFGALLIAGIGRRVRAPEDLAKLYGLPLLGVVPRSSVLARLSGPLGSSAFEPLPQREEEVFQVIRARLRYFKIDREVRTLLVISPGRGEGKTTIARHLASAAARIGAVVLLVEADLRTPALAWQLGLQPGPGLADVVIGEVSLWSATQLADVDAAPVDGPHARSLDVLAAGVPLPPNPGKLIKSQSMQGMLEEAKSTYDLVVIDTPPLTAAPDAFPLMGKVDGVIVVARGGRPLSRASAMRLRASLDAAGAPLLGVIANCARGSEPDSGAGASHPYQQAADSPNGRSPSARYTQPAASGSPPQASSDARPRSSSRFKRAAAEGRLQAEQDPRETAPN